MGKVIEILEIEGFFDDRDIRWEMKDVNILVGDNGSGKTTILHTILNLLLQKNIKTWFKPTSAHLYMTCKGELHYKMNTLELKKNEISALIKNLTIVKEESNEKNLTSALNKIKELNEAYSGSKNVIFEKFNSIRMGNIRVHVEYISTMNIIADSKILTDDYNGEEISVLDLMIDREIERMSIVIENKESKERCSDFIDSLNSFYKDTHKKVSIVDNKKLLIKKNYNKKETELKTKSLSSGEKQVLYILLKAFNANKENTIFLMDEPEVSLHVLWQKRLLSSFRRINKNSQLIIVTHSPSIVIDGWLSNMKDIKEISINK